MDITEGSTLSVRKGAWTEEEDELLRACIQKYGDDGKWYLVPQRAGLNRCRRSCRLRWLNYLNPNINRENFKQDEVDIILRLHKLLGNRWALIAARLPGRTANSVKNYWHTNLRSKVASNEEDKEKPKETAMKPQVVIKPQPRTFSKNSPWLRGKLTSASASDSSTVVSANDNGAGDPSRRPSVFANDNGARASECTAVCLKFIMAQECMLQNHVMLIPHSHHCGERVCCTTREAARGTVLST